MSGQGATQDTARRLSIIIPTLNEQHYLAATLERLDETRDEIIVVDGGSADRTRDVARAAGARVITAPRGRARQMNAGAAAASGEILLFLHADTHPPTNYAACICDAIDGGAVGGAFTLAIDAPNPLYRSIETAVRIRSRYLGLPYGDQALFVSRSAFAKMRGFREIEIMEDFDFVRRIRRHGKFSLLDARVTTSARRWQRVGPIRVTIQNQVTVLGYLLGIRMRLSK